MLDTFSHFLSVVAITIAPGPVVLMLMVRAAGNDVKGAVGFGLGFSLGGLLIITAVCFGLSAWLIVALSTFAALVCGVGLVVVFAAQIRRLARSAKATMIKNRSRASLLGTGGGWMVLS